MLLSTLSPNLHDSHLNHYANSNEPAMKINWLSLPLDAEHKLKIHLNLSVQTREPKFNLPG